MINVTSDKSSQILSAITEIHGPFPRLLLLRGDSPPRGTEEALIRQRSEQNTLTVLEMAASKRKTAKPSCSNCKRSSHSIDFCILSGGNMAGHSIDEARAAQRAALGKPPRGGKGENEKSKLSNTTTTTHVAPTPFPDPMATPSAAATTSLAHYGDDDIPLSGDFVEYHGDRNLVAEPQKNPFIFDIGATCHISSERSDFKILKPCATRPVKGLFGSCVYAVGIGTIDLHLDAGRTLSLHDVLFVPASTIRLISISSLHRGGKYTTHFDSDGCWVSDKSNQIVAHGAVSPTWQLYPLIATDPCVSHSSHLSFSPPTALCAARVPNVETWH